MFRFVPQRRLISLTFDDVTMADLSSDDYLEALHIGPVVIPFLPFKEATEKIDDGYSWTYEPDLEKWGERGNQIISLKKEREILLAEVRYDREANKIFPPN